MKRIKYPPRGSREFDDLKTNYKAIYAKHELQTMEDGWNDWKLEFEHPDKAADILSKSEAANSEVPIRSLLL